MKKISIIIVNYNCENFIVSLLENLNYQTMSKDQFEVICVNNNQNNLLTELCSSTTYDFNLQIINNPYN